MPRAFAFAPTREGRAVRLGSLFPCRVEKRHGLSSETAFGRRLSLGVAARLFRGRNDDGPREPHTAPRAQRRPGEQRPKGRLADIGRAITYPDQAVGIAHLATPHSLPVLDVAAGRVDRSLVNHGSSVGHPTRNRQKQTRPRARDHDIPNAARVLPGAIFVESPSTPSSKGQTLRSRAPGSRTGV